jgi:hypothetical protein
MDFKVSTARPQRRPIAAYFEESGAPDKTQEIVGYARLWKGNQPTPKDLLAQFEFTSVRDC